MITGMRRDRTRPEPVSRIRCRTTAISSALWFFNPISFEEPSSENEAEELIKLGDSVHIDRVRMTHYALYSPKKTGCRFASALARSST